MTRLIDVHAPQHDVTETLVLHVDATPAAVFAAADRLGTDPFAGVEALGATRNQRAFRLAWHPKPGRPGRVDVVWDISVTPDAGDGCYLSSTRRFVASDDAARAALRDQWRIVRSSVDAIARQTLRAVKRCAEDAPVAVAHPVVVPLAA